MPKIVILFPAQGSVIEDRETRAIEVNTNSFEKYLFDINHNLVFNQFLTTEVFDTSGTVEDVYNRYSDKARDDTLEVYLSNKITFKNLSFRNLKLKVPSNLCQGP